MLINFSQSLQFRPVTFRYTYFLCFLGSRIHGAGSIRTHTLSYDCMQYTPRFLLNERIGIKYETEQPLNKRIMAFDQNDQIGRFFNVFKKNCKAYLPLNIR